jgi:phage terminase small subunit
MDRMSKLTDKHKSFCHEYIKDMNGTQAYIRAGYSEKGARVSASQLLSNPNIQEYLAELVEKQFKKAEVTTEEIIKGIADIARDNLEETQHKLKAWDMLGRYMNIYEKEKQSEAPKIEIKYVGDK